MRFQKKYLLFIAVILVAIFLKLNTWSDNYGEVKTFRGANLSDEVFTPLIAASMNANNQLQVYVDGEKLPENKKYLIFDESLEKCLSLECIREYFDYYAGYLNEETVVVNNKTSRIEISDFETYQNDRFINLETAKEIFGFEYSWDDDGLSLYIDTENMEKGLPEKYDLRKNAKVGEVIDQGSFSDCWAIASAGAMNSTILPEVKEQISFEKIVSKNPYGSSAEKGGDFTMALAYLLGWKNDNPIDVEDDIHLQEVHFLGRDDFSEIKRSVLKYGAVSSSMYMSSGASFLAQNDDYNSAKNAYCYKGSKNPNHEILIIGWDDNYPKENFKSTVTKNGAFLCQNSWGKSFGDNGTFYVSYEDSVIGSQCVSYVSVDTNKKYDEIHQSDLCGWVGQIGFGQDSIYGASVYSASNEENIKAAGFYALGKDTTYRIGFVENYKNVASLDDMEIVAEGTLDYPGYYTIDFDYPRLVSKGENFAIVLYIETPGTTKPLAVEYMTDENKDTVDISDGVQYISQTAETWDRCEEGVKANICLKAYGQRVAK